MNKNTVFSQVIKLIPRTQFQEWTTKHGADFKVRTLNSWTWFGGLLFGQLTGHDSIRAIERIFAVDDPTMAKLGFGPLRKSTLADANRTRGHGLLEEVYEYCLSQAHKLNSATNGFSNLKRDIFAMDSTTIELCLSLCPWAVFHHNKGACKLHTAIDIAGDLPQFAIITDGRVHDIQVAREMTGGFKRDDIVVFDRAYIDYEWLNALTAQGTIFVTRAKSNMRFKVVESKPVDKKHGLRADQTIYLTSQAGKTGYKGKLRRISFRDPDTGKWLVFLTNNIQLAATTICKLYKARWKVELFFKTLKQNLKIKKFLGTNEKAVKTQIFVALIAYLLIQILRFSLNSSISIPDALAVIGVLLLRKECISRLLGELPRITRHPPSFQLTFF